MKRFDDCFGIRDGIQARLPVFFNDWNPRPVMLGFCAMESMIFVA